VAPYLPPDRPKPKGGRPRLPDRAALAGIVFVLRHGLRWRDLPRELGYGSGVTCWRRLRAWQALGVWEAVHHTVLNWLGLLDAIRWERASLDSTSVRAKRGGEATGPSPTDRGKRGSKYHLVVDQRGARWRPGSRRPTSTTPGSWSPSSMRSRRSGGRSANRGGPAAGRRSSTGTKARTTPSSGGRRGAGASPRGSPGAASRRVSAWADTDGSWREPNHSTPFAPGSTDAPAGAIIGLSGLLHLVEAVGRVRVAQAARPGGGPTPCPAPPSSPCPPARGGSGGELLGGPAAGPAPAAAGAAESPAGAAAAAARRGRRGGRP
jgi:transposase